MNSKISLLYNFFTNKIYFKLYYLLVSIFFITAFSLIPNINLLTKVAIIWGVLLLASDFLKFIFGKQKLEIIKLPIYIFVILTLIFNIIIYPDLNNIKIWLINLMIFFIFFSIDSNKNKYDLLKEIKLFSILFVALSFLISSVSLLMILTDTIIKIPKDPTYLKAGYYEYIGLFSNGNAFGIFSAVSIIFSIYLLLNVKSLKSKIFLIVNLLIQFSTLILSGGRSAYFAILSLVFVYIYVYLNKSWIRISIIVFPLAAIIVFVSTHFHNLRPYLAGRENIWLAASKVIKNNPITGVGNTNMVPMVDAAKEKWLYGVQAGGLHNIYIETATVNGLLACFLLIVFIIITYFYLVNKIDLPSTLNKNSLTILLSLFVGLALVNLLESTLLYKVSFIGIIFWSITGYLLALLKYDS